MPPEGSCGRTRAVRRPRRANRNSTSDVGVGLAGDALAEEGIAASGGEVAGEVVGIVEGAKASPAAERLISEAVARFEQRYACEEARGCWGAASFGGADGDGTSAYLSPPAEGCDGSDSEGEIGVRAHQRTNAYMFMLIFSSCS